MAGWQPMPIAPTAHRAQRPPRPMSSRQGGGLRSGRAVRWCARGLRDSTWLATRPTVCLMHYGHASYGYKAHMGSTALSFIASTHMKSKSLVDTNHGAASRHEQHFDVPATQWR
eukprot:366559-Chlamydomonas_euryale.AAC.5